MSIRCGEREDRHMYIRGQIRECVVKIDRES